MEVVCLQTQKQCRINVCRFFHVLALEVVIMLEAISLDAKTIIIRADKASDLSNVIDFISKKDKRANIDSFLKFASQNRVMEKGFKFNRDECYDR